MFKFYAEFFIISLTTFFETKNPQIFEKYEEFFDDLENKFLPKFHKYEWKMLSYSSDIGIKIIKKLMQVYFF